MDRAAVLSVATTRNRAIDFYRAAAMGMVAVGHWLVVAFVANPDGSVEGLNALGEVPSLAVLTWIFQVMPLFFVIGGYANAASLDSHWRRGGRSQDWVATRLRRLTTPTAALAGTWLGLLALSPVLGGMVGAAAVGAAIPLWFLANYTIDTAIAPYTITIMRRRPALTLLSVAASITLVDVMHIGGVPFFPYLNLVLVWIGFQMLGFAWRDGLLPTGRSLVTAVVAAWTTAISLVAFGPWPVTMVHAPGVAHSPTHPPSLALAAFGLAYSLTAIALAPSVSGWLERSPRAWLATAAANGRAMTIYLWHMTAAIAVAGVLHITGRLGSAPVGSSTWWAAKPLYIGLCIVVLAVIVTMAGRVEQRALLSGTRCWTGSNRSLWAVVALITVAVKVWVSGSALVVAVGAAGVVIAALVLARQSTAVSADGDEVKPVVIDDELVAASCSL